MKGCHQHRRELSLIAARLKQMAEEPVPERSVFRFNDGARQQTGDHVVRSAKPALPDPRLVRQIIRQRHLRSRHFAPGLFADPAWDILLDLTAARAEHRRVSITSLCIAAGVPHTTALRWIGHLVDLGILNRSEDTNDRRRAFITLSEKTADTMARYFDEIPLKQILGV